MSERTSWKVKPLKAQQNRLGLGQGPPLLPIPKIDAIECWLPQDTPEGRDLLMADLKEVLKQHRTELEFHMEDVFRRLSTETHSKRLQDTEDMLRRVLEDNLNKQLEEDKAQLGWTSSGSMAKGTQLAGTEEDELLDVRTPGTALPSEERARLDKEEGISPEEAPSRQRASKLRAVSFDHSEKNKRRKMRLRSKANCTAEGNSEGEGSRGCQTFLRDVVESSVCETITSSIILSNVIFLGLEVQVLRGVPDQDMPIAFKVAEWFYSTFFFCEWLLRFLSHGFKEFFLGPNWCWHNIDTFLVCASLLEILMDFLLEFSANLEFLRVIRVVRTVRVLRVVRIVSFFRPLRILVYSVMHTVRSLTWVIMLLAIVVYVFGMTFTLAASQAAITEDIPQEVQDAINENFGSLWSTMVILFKSITGGMDWSDASDPLEAVDPIWSWLFMGYIAFCNLSLLNVVTGVVCQTAIQSANEDQDIVVQSQLCVRQKYIEQLQELFVQVDADKSGKITLIEFEDKLQDESLQRYFEILELTMDEAWSLFKLLDTQNTGMIDIDEFVTGCLKLRGTARSIDMHMLIYQSRWTMDRVSTMLTTVAEMAEQIRALQRVTRSSITSRQPSGSTMLPVAVQSNLQVPEALTGKANSLKTSPRALSPRPFGLG